MKNTIYVVAGAARSGTSLMMQILDASGVKCTGDPPAYETTGDNPVVPTPEALKRANRYAIKVLEPQEITFPRHGRYHTLWMRRDHAQQALSQAKMLRLLAGLNLSPDGIDAMRRSLARTEPLALEGLKSIGPVEIVEFERLLLTPLDELQGLGRVLRFPLDGSCIVGRSPDCRADMSIELSLLEGSR